MTQMTRQTGGRRLGAVRRIVLLAGSAEGREAARRLAAMPGVALTVLPMQSARGSGRGPALADPDSLFSVLRRRGADAVLDATHPFATALAGRAAEMCRTASVPYLRLARPGWTAGPGDRWTRVTGEAEAGRRVPPCARVFVATGAESFAALAPLAGRTAYIRSLGPPALPFPFERGRFVVGEGPFTAGGEAALFRGLGIDWMVVRDAGGSGGWPKLAAARQLGLRVAMIDRPPQPDAPRVETAEAAAAWLMRALA